MAIPEAQLETWSHQGAVAQSRDTYASIKNTLEAPGTPYAGKDFRVFLQGSYGNDTNIWTESDVDVVIELDDLWHRDLTDLPEPQKDAYMQWVTSATYKLTDFKRDVHAVLKAKYGNAVESGDKAISIAASGNRRKADVIVAVQYRRYSKFITSSDQLFIPGICFHNKAKQLIANYPKQHSDNLTNKNIATKGWRKPLIRTLKNLRGRCVSVELLDAGLAPSYYLEGLLYNVPSTKFGGSYSESLVKAITWIQQGADKQQLLCANEQYYLLRDGFHTSWPPVHAEAFLQAVVTLWDNWQ